VTRPLSSRASPFAFLLALAAAPAIAAPHALPAIEIDSATNVDLSLTTPFWEAPATGYVPIHASLRNRGHRACEYRLTFDAILNWQGMRTESTFVVGAPAEAEREFDLVVPLGDDGDRGTRNMRVELLVSGPGAPSSTVSLYQTTYAAGGRGEISAPIAMSESLATRHWDFVKTLLESSEKTTLVGGRFDPASLPDDWRSYLGYSAVVLTAEEWEALATEKRRGLEQWIAQGGHVVRMGAENARERRGTGLLDTRARGPFEDATTAALPGVVQKEPRATLDYSSWAPLHRLGAPPLPVTAISLFMIAYAVVVGPLNLFLAARRPARDRALRVIWSIPALSVAASAILAVAILVNDGLGGDGYRFTVIAIDPENHEAAVAQEQAARTGLLLASSFRSREPLAIMSLPFAEDLGARTGRQSQNGEVHSGWFHSRTLQGQILRTARPSRARLTRTMRPDGTIEIQSSLPDTLDHLYWCDATGGVWYAADVAPGRPTALTRKSADDFERWWRGQNQWFPARLRDTWGHETAFGTAAHSKSAIETLETLRWQRQDALYIQPLR
jgi:hypothetical protein